MLSLYCVSVYRPATIFLYEDSKLVPFATVDTLEDWQQFRFDYDSVYCVHSISYDDDGFSLTLCHI